MTGWVKVYTEYEQPWAYSQYTHSCAHNLIIKLEYLSKKHIEIFFCSFLVSFFFFSAATRFPNVPDCATRFATWPSRGTESIFFF